MKILLWERHQENEKTSHIPGESISKPPVSDKQLAPRIPNKLKNSTTNNPIKKWTKDLNGQFVKEDILLENKYMNEYPILISLQGNAN